MQIAESSIIMGADHLAQEKQVKHETLTTWQTSQEQKVTHGKKGKGKTIDVAAAIAAHHEAVKVKISSKAHAQPRHVRGLVDEVPKEEEVIADLNIRILKALVERFTGRKIDMVDPDVYKDTDSEEGASHQVIPLDQAPAEARQDQSAGYGLVYEYYESYHEYEETNFAASGVIKTADGKEISFNTSLSMSREFMTENSISIKAGDALKDPLVINFDGKGVELSEREFHFDIDSDGIEDQLSFVGPGSGFLALDSNGDGVINNGTELFGARSGDGFAELQHYDSDNNNWIDENDDIYENLRIWTRDSSGESKLLSLGQKGVGAIYLGHVSSPFSVKDGENNLLGQIQSTGIFLSENGLAGTVQQVDLVA